MKVANQCLDDLPNNLAVVTEMCIDDQIVILTKDGQAEIVMASKKLFDDLVTSANEKEMYRELWQAEVHSRQGKMLSAKKAIEEIDKL